MTDDAEVVTFVIPVFHSPGTLSPLVARISEQMAPLGVDWEVLLLMDGDGEQLWKGYIQELPTGLPVRALRLSRNFGQHRAIRFGIRSARPGAVFIMDCDLQDPPEVIPRVLAPVLARSCDVVFTRRRGQYDDVSRAATRRIYSRTLTLATGMQFEESLGPVIALSNRARGYVNRFEEDAHILNILTWLDLPHVIVDYERQKRPLGRSSYTLRKRIRHALRGLAFSSTRFIAVSFAVSFAIGLAAIVGMLGLVLSLVNGSPPSGWLSLISVVVLGFAMLGMLLSVVGGLLLEVLNLVRARPLAVVAEEWRSRDA